MRNALAFLESAAADPGLMRTLRRGDGSSPRFQSCATRRAGEPYKREYGEPDEKAQDNFTDPESRIIEDLDSRQAIFKQCYNCAGGQSMVLRPW